MSALNVANAQWTLQNPFVTEATLSSVYFTDVNTGYAVGEYGTIIKTANGGTTWTALSSGTTWDLYSVYFTDANTGYAVGGISLRTTDGGTNWVLQTVGPGYSVHFPDTDTGYIVGGISSSMGGLTYCTIFKTTNGGENWEYQGPEPDIIGSLNSVHFPKTHTGYAVGRRHQGSFPLVESQSFIIKTINSGESWIECHTFPWESVWLNSIYFINVDTGYIADSGILKTTDGGITWVTQNSNSTRKLSSVHFPSAETGYVVGGDDYDVSIILKTTDGGANWVTQDSGTYANLLSVHFPTVDTGYAVGVGGTILKTVNGGGFPVGSNAISSKSSTLKIYPNPASECITIETSAILTPSTIAILNLHGQQIIIRQITEHKTQINISELPSGVYFVRLKNEKTVSFWKFIKQ